MHKAKVICIATIAACVVAGFMGIQWIDGYHTKRRAEKAAELAANIEKWKIPYKTSEGGGCEIWTFNPDGKYWRYFSVCPGKATVTPNTWLECTSSKAYSCTVRSEPMTVEGK